MKGDRVGVVVDEFGHAVEGWLALDSLLLAVDEVDFRLFLPFLSSGASWRRVGLG